MLYDGIVLIKSLGCDISDVNELINMLSNNGRFKYLKLNENPNLEKEKIEHIIKKNKIPVILCSLDIYSNDIEQWNFKFMTVLIYKAGENIDIEWKKCIYSIANKSIENTCGLLVKLWELQCTGGGFSRSLIELMIDCDLLVKNGNKCNISNASYDLSLGDEYYYAGNINSLNDKSPFVAIEPYDYVIASCAEKVQMPRDVVGRFDVSVNLFCQGIILSNSTQVDPGFRGKLFCLLFNTSNKVVYLKRGTHFVTLEFNKLIEPTTAYNGKYENEDSIVAYLPSNVMQGAINELKKEIEKLRSENQKMQGIYLSALALFLAIISIFLVIK